MQSDVLNGMRVMHSNGVTHGNIRPEYIGYDARNKNYMLMDRFDYDKPLEKLM